MLDQIRQKGWQSVRAAARPGSARTSRSTALPPAPVLSSAIPLAGPSRLPWSFDKSKRQPNHVQSRRLHLSHDFASPPSASSRKPHQPTPLDEITRLRELINRANATNSKLSKERILAEFDDLKPLLAFLYDPYSRLHVSSSNVHKYLWQRNKDDQWQNQKAPLMSIPSNRSQAKTRAAALRSKQEDDVRSSVPATLLELFQQLSSRRITGHEALATIRIFLESHSIIEQHKYALGGYDDPNLSTSELFRRGLLRPTSLEIFYRCLDRNLKAGFRENILRQAFSLDSSSSSDPPAKGKSGHNPKSAHSSISFRGSFEVALGRTVTREELPALFANETGPAWFASRKLDGVRCLFVVRLQQEQSETDVAEWKVVSILALSRNGRTFSSLAVLEREIARLLPSYPGLPHLLDQAQSSTASSKSDSEAPTSATFVLDGEVCVLRPPDEASASAARQLDAKLESDQALPSDPEHVMVEDFAAIVGLIRRKTYTISKPAFFPFDFLTLEEFTNWRRSTATTDQDGKTRRTFSQRLDSLASLVSFFESDARQRKQESLVRKLSQNKVSSAEEVERLLETASRSGWEGIVLRQDTAYEGKRTSAIRKFKEWKDAEYTVQGIQVAMMRLPIDGCFEEREAMASIQIHHKGTSVSVGSGFTPNQRIEFAKNPEQIIGKVVTVEYFDESKTLAPSSARPMSINSLEGGDQAVADGQTEVYSLRFPRIKHIWGTQRDV